MNEKILNVLLNDITILEPPNELRELEYDFFYFLNFGVDKQGVTK